ncbi:NADP-dependent malic enzyme [Sphingosinicella sp. LHD-64]|uniref:NADP-dependent malic enzyme n=1 Tax=Sphingosinicella sp. LHD-64 TaxID=3072139 RepID=UPI00280F24B0|nr:NADP-dependent malic enzyme [Sphingosinicella sp. LHD-64]MDQ8756948.1 NADP-dependent malic enzyme [Sphingosinicella sp. LHD-64]
MSEGSNVKFSEAEALEFHASGRPGKIEIIASKPMATQRDLSLAYSPGVAVPVRAIAEDPSKAYDYTAKGNLVAVISNGTAILGLGNLGALASKPVMEGKAVLFKRFADVDSIDLELKTEDVDRFIDAVELLEPSFGGINLEDIKAPECFIIEQTLRERMNIPVMHDDQHGTAIISAAGLINACYLTGRELKDVKVVVNGAGAAAIACTALVKAMGVRNDHVTMCDRTGVIYEGRTEGMDQWKSAHAVKTGARTLAEAMKGADVFLGLSAAGALKPEMVKDMAPQPIIFAMANPDPEITPPEAKAVRPDAIVATGRSDYPNQVNNVLGFPFIFRGALDVRATAINEEMKIAAAQALADLAREAVPEEVAAAYGKVHSFGADYIIPAPFDPRLMEVVPAAVAQAAIDTGVAQRPIADMAEYRTKLRARLNPTTSVLSLAYESARANPRRVLFAEGEEDVVLRAAIAFRDGGYGIPILVGRDDVHDRLRALGVEDPESFPVFNSRHYPRVPELADYLYQRLQRRGYLQREVERVVNQDRNIFAALLLAAGEADVMITGVTRTYAQSLRQIRRVLDPLPGVTPFGIHVMVGQAHTVFIADTTVTERPAPEQLAEIAIRTAEVARRMGHEPRVAFLSYSIFGNPEGSFLDRIRDAVKLLDKRDDIDFEYEGEMPPDVALNPAMHKVYPFSRLTGPANVLIMPGLQTANISAKLLKELGGDAVIGPMLVGMQHQVQIAPMTATASDLVTLAVLAAGRVAQ